MNGTQTLAVPIYGDAAANQVVLGTMTTTVAPTIISAVTTYRATVAVQYKYQGRDYSFSMSTLRASDQ